MKVLHPKFSLAGLAVALALSGCAVSSPPAAEYGSDVTAAPHVPLPTFYGLYALNGGDLVRLDGPSAWERSTWPTREDLPPDVSFLVFSRDLAVSSRPLDSVITVGRAASVNYERTSTGELITHQPGSVWASPDLPGYQFPLEFEPVADHPDMIIAKPVSQLPAGLYSLKLKTAEVQSSRFGIAWSSVNESQYAASYCIEKDPSGYAPCGATTPGYGPAAGVYGQQTARFLVRNLHSSHIQSNDGAPALLIQGELINNSSIPAIMPALSATLLDAQNQVLQALPAVTLPATPLAPGGVYDFRINVTNPAANASQVRVTPTA
jgi:Protein of unknown function (DUF3426)